jgi:hypothetical protein
LFNARWLVWKKEAGLVSNQSCVLDNPN